jgi:signal transduction histidine kinase
MVDTLPVVKAGQDAMIQLFQNFVSNALKFHVVCSSRS